MADTITQQGIRKPFLECVAEYFTAAEWRFRRDEREGNAINTRVRGNHATYNLRFVVNEEGALVTFLVFGPTLVPGELRPEVLELLNLLNDRYMVGNFEYSVARRDVIFRVGYDLEGGVLSQEMIHNMIRAGVTAYDEMFPALMSVCFSGISPAAAMVRMGGQPSEPSED